MQIQENTLVFRLSDNNSFTELKNNVKVKNFIADLTGVELDVVNKIKDKFIIFARSVSEMKGSFVIVYELAFDDDLIIIPTLQEAYDYIEMEEIERQLEL